MRVTPKKEKWVGGLTFLALLGIIFASYVNKDDPTSGGTYRVEGVFSKIDGLLPEADVRLGGVTIGHVSDSRLNENYSAVVGLEILKGYEIPQDTAAAIHTDGLFGAKYIELEPGGSEKSLTNGARIDMTQSSVVVEDLLELIISEGKARQAQKAP